MGKLRENMQKDMVIRDLSSKTQEVYLERMKSFVLFHGKSPELFYPWKYDPVVCRYSLDCIIVHPDLSEILIDEN